MNDFNGHKCLLACVRSIKFQVCLFPRLRRARCGTVRFSDVGLLIYWVCVFIFTFPNVYFSFRNFNQIIISILSKIFIWKENYFLIGSSWPNSERGKLISFSSSILFLAILTTVFFIFHYVFFLDIL